jgi:hypothetical protein
LLTGLDNLYSFNVISCPYFTGNVIRYELYKKLFLNDVLRPWKKFEELKRKQRKRFPCIFILI